jgi:hypothetical protein
MRRFSPRFRNGRTSSSRRLRQTLFFVALLATMSGPARACAVLEQLSPAHLSLAPIIVAGTVTAYETDGMQGVLTVTVTQGLRGNPLSPITVIYPNEYNDWPPESWDRPVDVLIGLIPAPDGTFLIGGKRCGRAWIIPDDADSRAIIAATMGILQ